MELVKRIGTNMTRLQARKIAEKYVEIVQNSDGEHYSMKLKGRSNLLWYSSDLKLMRRRQKDMIKTLIAVILESHAHD